MEKHLTGDQVSHPSHYNQGRFEVIEVIEDQKLGFHLGNAIKYICRAGKKNPEKTVEDLQKAKWYIERQIEILKPQDQIRRPNDMNLKEETSSVKEYLEKIKAEMDYRVFNHL